ncbi:MAG: pyrroline-5-carboxylate reductase [Candidatus Sumerlaeia bacterium]
MSDWKLGLIGCGNMGSALLAGVVKAGVVSTDCVGLTDVDAAKASALAADLGAKQCVSNGELLEFADVVILAVKPQVMGDVLAELASSVREKHLFISIAAGIPLSMIEGKLGGDVRAIRVMPNTPALLGCGASGLAKGRLATDADMQRAIDIFQAVGVAVEVDEDQINAVTGLSGSGPAYVFRMAEVLVRAGEKAGLDAAASLMLARQTILGAARMMTETTDSPEELRRKVTSPGGTTEAGLKVMDEGGFAELIEKVVIRARDRGDELGKMLQ